MQLFLPGFIDNYFISGVNSGNNYIKTTKGNSFFIQPGVYIIAKKKIGLAEYSPAEFYAPLSITAEPFVIHKPFNEVSANKSFSIFAKIVGIDSTDKISIEVRNSSNKWKTLIMQRLNTYDYTSDIPADMVSAGVINYRVMIQRGNKDFYTFPGGFKGNPYAWDEYRNESWQTFIATDETPLELFAAISDRNKIMLYNPDWRTNTVEYITAGKTNQLVLKATMNKPAAGQFMGWQYNFSDKILGRKAELSSFTKLVIRARSQQEMKLKLSLITADADAYTTSVSLTKDWKEIEIPLNSLQKDAFLLLPRPYPGFLPLRFKTAQNKLLNIRDIEKLEISFDENIQSIPVPVSIEVESVWLKK